MFSKQFGMFRKDEFTINQGRINTLTPHIPAPNRNDKAYNYRNLFNAFPTFFVRTHIHSHSCNIFHCMSHLRFPCRTQIKTHYRLTCIQNFICIFVKHFPVQSIFFRHFRLHLSSRLEQKTLY